MMDLAKAWKYLNIVSLLHQPTIYIMFGYTLIRRRSVELPVCIDWALMPN